MDLCVQGIAILPHLKRSNAALINIQAALPAQLNTAGTIRPPSRNACSQSNLPHLHFARNSKLIPELRILCIALCHVEAVGEQDFDWKVTCAHLCPNSYVIVTGFLHLHALYVVLLVLLFHLIEMTRFLVRVLCFPFVPAPSPSH
jgi:hypothetical protein